MSGLFCILISPILLLISIPLTIFATITTTLAFSTLFFRALLVYAELAAALIQDHFTITNTKFSPRRRRSLPSPKPILKESKLGRRRSRRSSATSESSNGSTTPKAPKSSGLGIYGGEGASRDFEGVGGWRISGPEGEDERWTSLNSRLELPATMDGRRRNHHRSSTSGSLNSYGLPLQSPPNPRAWSPHDRSASPEAYFANRAPSKSTTALDANIGRGLVRNKLSSSSSGSSQGSNRTPRLTLSSTWI